MKEDEKLREELRDLSIFMKKEQKKVKAIKINFGNGHLSSFNGVFDYDIYDYKRKNPYAFFSINFLEYKNIKFALELSVDTEKYVEKIDYFKLKILLGTRLNKLDEYFENYIFIYSSDCLSMNERRLMEYRKNSSSIDNINKD